MCVPSYFDRLLAVTTKARPCSEALLIRDTPRALTRRSSSILVPFLVTHRTAIETLKRNGGPNASGTERGIGYIDGMECRALFCQQMTSNTCKAFTVQKLTQARDDGLHPGNRDLPGALPVSPTESVATTVFGDPTSRFPSDTNNTMLSFSRLTPASQGGGGGGGEFRRECAERGKNNGGGGIVRERYLDDECESHGYDEDGGRCDAAGERKRGRDVRVIETGRDVTAEGEVPWGDGRGRGERFFAGGAMARGRDKRFRGYEINRAERSGGFGGIGGGRSDEGYGANGLRRRDRSRSCSRERKFGGGGVVGSGRGDTGDIGYGDCVREGNRRRRRRRDERDRDMDAVQGRRAEMRPPAPETRRRFPDPTAVGGEQDIGGWTAQTLRTKEARNRGFSERDRDMERSPSTPRPIPPRQSTMPGLMGDMGGEIRGRGKGGGFEDYEGRPPNDGSGSLHEPSASWVKAESSNKDGISRGQGVGGGVGRGEAEVRGRGHSNLTHIGSGQLMKRNAFTPSPLSVAEERGWFYSPRSRRDISFFSSL